MLLSEEQLDVFRELINIGVGRSASLLNDMIDKPIKLNIPNIWVAMFGELEHEIKSQPDMRLNSIHLGFKGIFSGTAEIMFPQESATNLVALLTGEEKGSPELDVIRAGTLNEVANVLLNGVMGSIGNILEGQFEYEVPVFHEAKNKLDVLDKLNEQTVVLYGETHFEVDDLDVEGDIILIMELPAFENLKVCLNRLIEE